MRRNILNYFIIILLNLILIVSGVYFVVKAKKAEEKLDINKALSSSFDLLSKGEYDRSRKILEAILKKDQGNPLALYNLASVMVAMKEFDKADTYLNEALPRAQGYKVQINRVCTVGTICMAAKPAATGNGNQDLEPLIKMYREIVKAMVIASNAKFPWPPPEASAFADIPPKFLLRSNSQTFFKDIASRLREAFEKAGYGEKSWYQIPNGFALVSRMEQIYPDGRPKEEEVRWTPNVSNPPIFSLESYIKALFTAPKGRYRVIVFFVTDRMFSQSEKMVSPEEAMAWLKRGFMEFPPEIGHYPYTKDHYCKALIYEFEQKDHNAILKNPSDLQGKEHLEKAKLWSALGG